MRFTRVVKLNGRFIAQRLGFTGWLGLSTSTPGSEWATKKYQLKYCAWPTAEEAYQHIENMTVKVLPSPKKREVTAKIIQMGSVYLPMFVDNLGDWYSIDKKGHSWMSRQYWVERCGTDTVQEAEDRIHKYSTAGGNTIKDFYK